MADEETPRETVIRSLMRDPGLADAMDVRRPDEWIELDRRVRTAYLWCEPGLPGHAWLTDAAHGAPAPDDGRIALALCTSDGRTREAALAHTADRPALLPLVALRTTDWAGPVRERARSLLAAALPEAAPDTLLLTAGVILRGRRRMRGDVAFRLLQETLATAPAEVVHALFRAEDRATRRFALDLALERGLYPPTELARIAAHDTDAVIQDRAATAVLAAGVPGDSLEPLLRASTGRVRSAGVTALSAAGRSRDADAFLFDRSALVRACARWVLRQDGRDPLALYRAACTDPATVPDRAPLGLAECGDRTTDQLLLWELIEHERPQVRAFAVAGLRLFEAAGDVRLLALLDDPAPAVAREVAKVPRPWAARLPEGELLRRTEPGRPAHGRILALRLLGDLGSAAYGETARRLTEDPDPEVRARLR
ncbi:hypothetical protein ABZ990_27400 [Streptomyces sp. NPDC046203]|uniref:hypothetical protein n=1 Tax=Streptomyces sp. NPDC046203 TaxID=3154602 RepID=UPI0033DB757A